jgi:hypothetical protein
LRPIEAGVSAETLRLLDSYFEQAHEVEVRFSRLTDIELRGYELRLESLRYSYTYHCDDVCPQLAGRLSSRLKTSKLVEGTCPLLTAVVLFRDSTEREFARILVGGDGSCLTMAGRTYVLAPDAGLGYLFSASAKVF